MVNDKKIEKELKSFKRKLDKDKIWFISLNESIQYDIFFAWKRFKYSEDELFKTKSNKKRFFKLFIEIKKMENPINKSISRNTIIKEILKKKDENIIN